MRLERAKLRVDKYPLSYGSSFTECVFTAISARASPHIISISPTAGPVAPVGSSLTINGSGFGTSASGNTVTVSGISTTPTSWSDTRIVAAVPGVPLTSVHEIGHKFGQTQHHEKTESKGKTYLMLRQFDISQKGVSEESESEKYPCRLSRQDWIRMNYVYPTPC
jgi:hypothetical protein